MSVAAPKLFGHIIGDASMLGRMTPWPKPTIEQVRNLMLSGRVLVSIENPPTPDDKLLSAVPSGLAEAVSAGRLFDLGHLPNAVIQSESKRGGSMFGAGHIGHPFRQHYALFHTWEEGGSIYLVDPNPKFDVPPELQDSTIPRFVIAETRCLLLDGQPALLVENGGAFGQLAGDTKFMCSFIPSVVVRRALNPADGSPPLLSTTGLAGNLADPFVTALLLLATDGITVDRIAPSPKLNHARVKSGKPPIPAHWRVATGPYITALSPQRGGTAGPATQGHHASPAPHLRRGHLRHLHLRHGGGTVWVRDALVNLKDPDAPLTRAFYQVQRPLPGGKAA